MAVFKFSVHVNFEFIGLRNLISLLQYETQPTSDGQFIGFDHESRQNEALCVSVMSYMKSVVIILISRQPK